MIMETFKLAGLFLLVFIMMRLLGKTLLSQWTAYDLVTIIFLSYAGLGSVKIEGFYHGVLCIVIIAILYMMVSKLSLFGSLNRLIIGEPSMIIKHGEIIHKNLKRNRYSLTELLSTIRSFGYPDIQDIDFAILEPNGKISVIPKQEIRPVTAKQLNIETEYIGLPITIIAEGRIQLENVERIGRSPEWVLKELESHKYALKDVFYAYSKDNTESLTIFLNGLND